VSAVVWTLAAAFAVWLAWALHGIFTQPLPFTDDVDKNHDESVDSSWFNL
jgi:hypothetical protein